MSRLLKILERIEALERDGFDRCRREGKSIVVGCSQCAAVCINGCPCHESGCPNERVAKIEQREEEEYGTE